MKTASYNRESLCPRIAGGAFRDCHWECVLQLIIAALYLDKVADLNFCLALTSPLAFCKPELLRMEKRLGSARKDFNFGKFLEFGNAAFFIRETGESGDMHI